MQCCDGNNLFPIGRDWSSQIENLDIFTWLVKDKNCIFTGYNFSSKETSWYFIGIYVYEVKQTLTK